MGITSSLITGLSGLSSNQSQLDVIGNNIANVNTVGFKASQLNFQTQFSQSFSYGSAPNGDLGGTNPMQVGMGVVQGAITRDFGNGSRETTGVDSNLAIEGNGFFVLSDGSTQQYTRDGTFQLNSLNQLVNSSGLHVQGYGIDSNFNIVPGVLQNITVPLNELTVAQATSNVGLTGTLNTNGSLPTQVSDITLNQALYTSDGAGGVTGSAPTSSTLLTLASDATGNLYFQAGDTLTLTGTVGSNSVAAKTLVVSGTTTIGDLENFMTGTLGINTSTGANGSVATTPGVSLSTGGSVPAGAAVLEVDGNLGTANDISLGSSSLTITNSSGTTAPFAWTQNAHADGQSVATSTTVYDSLGTPVTLNVVATLLSKGTSGTTWQYYATSPDSTATGASQAVVGMGTLNFNTAGQFVNASNSTVTIDRAGTGAASNLAITLNFTGMSGMAASADASSGSASSAASTMAASPTDGSASGTLSSYSIDASGIIQGKFTNGLTRKLGQVALATFRNDQGLIDEGNNNYEAGPNSGTAVITAPGQGTAGSINSGTLELSNVDLSAEFVKLISASTGFSASSRVITTSNQLLQELLSAAR